MLPVVGCCIAERMHLPFIFTWISLTLAQMNPLAVDIYQLQLKQLLQKLFWSVPSERCFAIITDEQHLAIYDQAYFMAVNLFPRPYYMIRVNASDDLQSPMYNMKSILRSIKSNGCDLHLITLLNGWQVKYLLKYVYNNRALNMQQRFVLLHDVRLFTKDMLHVWSVFVKALFLRYNDDNSFSISTIAYPGILSGILVIKQLGNWSNGKHIDGHKLFKDKTSNLLGAQLSVAIADHVPMAHLNRTTNRYQGVEVEIMNVLAMVLNFEPLYYNFNANELETWEQNPLENDSYLDAGIIGAVAHHSARFGIGDIHLFESYVQLVELSLPHSIECLTFLTPESSSDNSWQTFIVPFSGGMWIGVLLSLFAVGTIFYVISFFNALLMDSNQLSFFRCLRQKREKQLKPHIWKSVGFRIALSRYRPDQELTLRGDIFDDYTNCILLTYSMLLYVALPRMPRNWPLRVLTGWYWIYCILLVATYRASFTAILANPAARVTIDTLEELNRARIPPSTGTIENKQLFLDASDDVSREVGANMEIMDQIEGLTDRIARGRCAYYDNEFYLRYLRKADNDLNVGSTGLHIMKECVVHLPVVLALEKNSALKPHVDNIIQRLSEGGLISKWLHDEIEHLPAEEQAPQEALMNLHKFWSSFVALGIGYLISLCAIIIEYLHFKYIVMQHPIYDVYNPSLYYNFKRLYPDE